MKAMLNINAVAMGIAINCYILFMDFSAGRLGGSTENPRKLLLLKRQPHMRQAAGIIGEGVWTFTG
jgi:hypothetical protein